MHKVEFHRRVHRALRRIPRERSKQILNAIEELASTVDPTSHHNVLPMQGNMRGRFRMRVGEYRVIFTLRDDGDGGQTLVILVSDVGQRGGIYG